MLKRVITKTIEYCLVIEANYKPSKYSKLTWERQYILYDVTDVIMNDADHENAEMQIHI